jgi:hypothetical protein
MSAILLLSFVEQKTVANPRDGRVGFEGLGYLSGSLENGNWSSESRGEFSPVQITNVGAIKTCLL